MTAERPLRVVAVLEHRGDGITALLARSADPEIVALVEERIAELAAQNAGDDGAPDAA